MPSLANIFDEKATVLDALVEIELGEIDEHEAAEFENQALAYLGELVGQEADKVDAIGFVQDQTKSQIDLLKEQEAKIRNRRKALENASIRLRQYILEVMQNNGLKKVKGNSRTIFTRSTESVAIDVNPQDLPDYLVEMRIEYKPRKADIKKALKDGVEIPGARLETKQSVTIR